MNAVLYRKGKTPIFVYAVTQKPVPKDDELLVKIAAVSTNAADCRMLKLGMIPKRKIFGSAVAGTIVETGKGVRKFAVGDTVCADISESGFGGFAEYVAVPKKRLAVKPSNIPFDKAAAIPLAATTALQSLRRGGVRPGQKVLIIGAGGGVGTFAVQLAKHFGSEVTAVCGEKNVSVAQSLGVAHVIDYTTTDFTNSKERYDLILAINGKYPLSAYMRLLGQNGVCVVVGGPLSQIFKTILFGPFLSFGGRKMRVLSATPNADDLAYVLKLTEEGIITPIIDRHYPLSDAAGAIKYALEGHVLGKIVIEVDA